MLRKWSRTIFLIFLGFLLVGFAAMMRGFWVPAGLALLTVLILRPWHSYIEKALRGRRYIAATVTVLLTCLLIMIPLGGTLATIIVEILGFAQDLLYSLSSGHLAQMLDSVDQWFKNLLEPIRNVVGMEWNLRTAVLTGTTRLVEMLYKVSPKFVLTTANFGLQVALWIVFMIVLFADGPRLYNYFMEIAPIDPQHERQIVREVRGMMTAVFLGMIATAFTNALLMGIAFAICRIDQPLMWGLITFGFSFVPVVGAFSIWAGGAIYLLMIGAWPYALGMTIFGSLVIAQTDNIVKPLVMRGRVNIHPILLLLSILGGAQVMGAVGLIFGPVFIAILLAALQIYRQEFAMEGNT